MPPVAQLPERIVRGALIALAAAWRYGPSALFPGACRFEPSCSGYALAALRAHGAWRGGRLALGRLLRCHPWGGCGFDPVPPPAAQPPRF